MEQLTYKQSFQFSRITYWLKFFNCQGSFCCEFNTTIRIIRSSLDDGRHRYHLVKNFELVRGLCNESLLRCRSFIRCLSTFNNCRHLQFHVTTTGTSIYFGRKCCWMMYLYVSIANFTNCKDNTGRKDDSSPSKDSLRTNTDSRKYVRYWYIIFEI